MARTPEWEKLAIAQGDPKPAWPLPDVKPKFATWSIGGGRPAGCTLETCARWHAGIDLTGAPDGARIVAPEDAVVIGIDRGWSEGSKAAFLRTGTNLFLVLGGFKAGSHKEFGVATAAKVKKGQPLGRVLGSYGMIHLETYNAEGRSANSVWWKTEPAPSGLLNPTHYVERMVGADVSLLQVRQRLQALAALGYYKGDPEAAWGTEAEAALKSAQSALGVEADGKWGPVTEDAIQKALMGPCTSDECDLELGGPKTSSDALASAGRLGKILIGGAFVTVAIGVGLAFARPRTFTPGDLT